MENGESGSPFFMAGNFLTLVWTHVKNQATLSNSYRRTTANCGPSFTYLLTGTPRALHCDNFFCANLNCTKKIVTK